MRRFATVAAVLLLAACASANKSTKQKVEPDVSLVQLVGPSEQAYPTGDIEVKLGFEIVNRADDPITFKRLEITTMGGGGAYIIRPQNWPYSIVIPPKKEASVERWVKATAAGTSSRLQNAPVTIRAVLLFDTPAGAIQKVVVSNIGQYPGSSPG